MPKYLKTSILIILIILPISLSAETHVSGYVSGTWTVAGSPYIADSTIVIHQDSLLVMEPGVLVSFPGEEDSLKIDGDIHAWGTERDTIYIDFQDESILNIANTAQNNLVFEYCKITYIGGHPTIWEKAVLFDHCFVDGWDEILVHSSPRFVISNSYIFEVNTYYSIAIYSNSVFIASLSNHQSLVFAENNIFYSGLDAYGGIIDNNIIYFGLSGNYNTKIINNLIYGNVTVSLNNDTVAYNEIYGTLDINWGSPLVTNNLIVDPSNCISLSGGFIINNTLITFYQGSAHVIDVYYSCNPIIKNNIIIGDGYGTIGIYRSSNPLVDRVSYNTYWGVDQLYHNVIPGEGEEIADPRFYDFAEGNYNLLPDSPCIDSADPGSPLDPDRTPADRGYAFFDTRIDHPPAIDSPNYSIVQRGTEFTFTASAVDDGDFLNISFENLPAWLSPAYPNLIYDSLSVTGTVPMFEDDFTFTIIVEDGIAQTDTELVEVEVSDLTILSGITTGVLPLSGSPYLVADDVIVPEGSSLRIEPGCEIRAKYSEYSDFRPHIFVYGQLLAEGTEEDSVIFTGEREDLDVNDWKGIWFYDCNEDTSVIRYSEISGARKAIFAQNTPALKVHDNSFIGDNWGIYLKDSSDISIHHNYFLSELDDAIECWNSQVEISYNLFEGTPEGRPNIYLDSSNSHIHNNIFNVTTGINVNYSNPLIEHNIFIDSEYASIILANTGYATVVNNTIYGGYYGMQIYDVDFTLKNNIITDCEEAGINFHYGTTSATVTNNNIWCPEGESFQNLPDSLGYGQLASVNINGDSCDIYNNISFDPMFGGGDPFDYHLYEGSPCIDAGTDVGFPYLGLAPDMGAFEGDYLNIMSDDDDLVPKTYYLYPNYPNPFNSTTTIEFDLPKKEKAILIIYNVLGKEVRELCAEILPPGRHVFKFNPAAGGSGVYFVRFEAGNYVKVRKILLVK